MDEMNGSEKTQNDNKTVIDELMKGDLGVIEQFLIIDDSRKVVGKCLKIELLLLSAKLRMCGH